MVSALEHVQSHVEKVAMGLVWWFRAPFLSDGIPDVVILDEVYNFIGQATQKGGAWNGCHEERIDGGEHSGKAVRGMNLVPGVLLYAGCAIACVVECNYLCLVEVFAPNYWRVGAYLVKPLKVFSKQKVLLKSYPSILQQHTVNYELPTYCQQIFVVWFLSLLLQSSHYCFRDLFKPLRTTEKLLIVEEIEGV